MSTDDAAWAPAACTLPVDERPGRWAEVDDLLAAALQEQVRPSPAHLTWRLDRPAEGRIRALAARESACCSFVRFTVEARGEHVHVDIQVPAENVELLDALSARAVARSAG